MIIFIDIIHSMKKMLNRGLILFVFLSIIASAIMAMRQYGMLPALSAGTMMILSIIGIVSAVLLIIISYPRISNIKITLIAVTLSISITVFFSIIHLMDPYSRIAVNICNMLFIFMFIILIIASAIPPIIRNMRSKYIILFTACAQLLVTAILLTDLLHIDFQYSILQSGHLLLHILIPGIAFIAVLLLSFFSRYNNFHTGGIIMSLSFLFALAWYLRALPQWDIYYDILVYAMAPLMFSTGIIVHWISRISHMAFYDPLLRIYNRAYANKIISGEIQAHSGPTAIIMIDIDHFKKINDRYGHPFGDKVLKNTASILSEALVPDGILCRYGGEEFIVFMKYNSKKALKERLESIIKKVGSSKLKNGKKTISITVSMGVCTYSDNDKPVNERISRADRALYNSKRDGRNRITLK